VIIVAGHIVVEPAQRESYLAGCVAVIEQARRAHGCLDFAITADLIDASRINVYERWTSHSAVEAFRGSGLSDDQSAAIIWGQIQACIDVPA
jgi:quinol monooxygenase YgiN